MRRSPSDLSRSYGAPDLQAPDAALVALIQAADGPAFVKDTKGTYLCANAHLASAFGLADVAALIGRRDEEALSSELAAEARASDMALVESGGVQETQQEIAGRGLVWRRALWRNNAGQILGIVGLARDLVQTRTQAALLRESKDLLDLAQAAAGVGIFEWDVPSGRLRLSPQFLALYGLGAFDGRYETWRSYIFREDKVRVGDLIDNAFAAGARELNIEFRIAIAGSEAPKWIEARNIIFYDERQRPLRVAGVNVDITERKRAMVQLRAFAETLEDRVRDRTRALEEENEARQKAEALLRQSHKMEAVGQLTGGIAHDFNNMLTVILGGLEAIGRQVALLPPSQATARITRAQSMAVSGVKRAVTLTSRLLAFSRLQPLSPRALDANRLVAGVCELLRRSLGEAVSLETVLAGGLWPTYADANQLENALLNLALNARDAMPSGGKMTIETANSYLDSAYVAGLPESVAPGQYVLIAVADTGGGMDQITLEKAFEPFFTTKDVGKGTGLGLSQVYGFVRQSSGHVKIYSEPGNGTTVKIYLPRHTGDTSGLKADETSEAGGPLGSETILVVEDDEALRGHASEVLGEQGYRVLQADSGAAALVMLDANRDIDLLFTDVVMPGGMNGRQLAEEALRRQPGLKVLFTTGYTRNAIVHQGRLDPGLHLIVKPFSFQELAAKIRALLDMAAEG